MLRAALIVLMLSNTAAAEELAFDVKETAGLRRFGYPVEAKLRLPNAVGERTGFRIKGVPAQIRPVLSAGMITDVLVDFSANLGPNESKRYTLEYGPDVKPSEGKGDTSVEDVDGAFRVKIGGLTYEVPADLLGLFRSVATGKNDYLAKDSKGLIIFYRDQIPFRAGGTGPWGETTKGTITRRGPHAVALRFDGVEPLRGARKVKSVVELTFPRSKSWVRVDWSIDDPDGFVAGMGVDLNANLQSEPALIDFGAGSYIYTTLKKSQSALLDIRGPKWRIEQGGALFAEGAGRAENWAHMMDKSRCIAYASAATDQAEIRASGEGNLQGWRYFAREGSQPPRGAKQFTFWLHFVGMPAQIGALTSPQSMQSPLVVTPAAKE